MVMPEPVPEREEMMWYPTEHKRKVRMTKFLVQSVSTWRRLDRWKHPAHGDVYTPVTLELLELIDEMKERLGTWRLLAARSGLRTRQLRYLRQEDRIAISLRTMDRLITASGIGSLDDLVWFTPDDLVELGIWDPPHYLDSSVEARQEDAQRRANHELNRQTPRDDHRG
jgi:hypothetical protein